MITVLCVDDERDFLEIEKSFLEKTGDIKVETVTSAEVALNLLKINQYDAIISDYQLPLMDGLEFLKAVHHLYGNIPFILFTGRGREEVAILALNSGADFYLQKGGDLVSQYAELKNKVEKAVREHKSIIALKDSERRLSDIIDFLPDATFAIDCLGYVISWNRAMEEMTGVSADMMIGKGDYEYSIPFYGVRGPILIDLIFGPPDQIYSRYNHVVHNRDMFEAEVTISLPESLPKTLWVKAGMLYDQNCKIVGAIESIRDITLRKEVDMKLRESEERYRTLAESSPDLIYIIDRNDVIVYLNTFAACALKRLKEDVIGKKRSEFFPESSNKTQWINIKKVFDTGIPIRIESKVSFLDHDTWQDTRLIPLKNQNGEVIEVMGVTRDLTERYASEEKLRKAHEELQRLYQELILNKQ